MVLDPAVLGVLLQSCAPSVAPATMLAIIQVESEADPYRIGVNSGSALSRQPTNSADAIATARGLLRRGANFDAGLMQINSANFTRLGVSPETIFDPCTNLRAGARVLADNYARARNAGVSDPLRAALSEYNTGSRKRGLTNGYVGKVFAAAGSQALAAGQGGGPVSADVVGRILTTAFGGRVTDTLRPMNAAYGAENSYHKYGQAVDFVPAGSVGAITRGQIRSLMAANNIRILELLGPGDADHSDHWHLAFARDYSTSPPPTYDPPLLQTVAQSTASENQAQTPVAVEASLIAMDGDEGQAEEPAPPAWDVFGVAAWKQRQIVAKGGDRF